MNPKQPTPAHQVNAWQWRDVLLEHYRFEPQFRVSLPPHSHDCYQFGLALTDPGEYRYRGSYYAVPVGSLSVIHPGELHGVCGLGVRAAPTVFLSFYVPVSLVQQVCSERQGEQVSHPPFIAQPVILDRRLTQRFQYLHWLLSDPSSIGLEQESMLAEALRCLFRSHAQGSKPLSAKALSRSDGAVQQVREFLDAHYAEPVSHALLSEISGLSAYHLNRLFRQKFGIPPHRYQLQRRIDRAKTLLLTGWSPVEIAPALGFSQQSHFGEQFRRLVNVSPGRYGRQGART